MYNSSQIVKHYTWKYSINLFEKTTKNKVPLQLNEFLFLFLSFCQLGYSFLKVNEIDDQKFYRCYNYNTYHYKYDLFSISHCKSWRRIRSIRRQTNLRKFCKETDFHLLFLYVAEPSRKETIRNWVLSIKQT